MNTVTKIVKMETWAKYESFIFVGMAMVILTSLKLLEIFDFSSDWLWFIAGVGLVIGGAISLSKQRKFDRKYKIIERQN